ncbi:hypothetical protein TNCV_1447931 [Trichonephila clavipes]|nr:hypothetical protein TNCV_1447931 [Trichonephila clavipes]
MSVPLGSRPPCMSECYGGNNPGAALLGTGSRWDETTLARFRSGHTRFQRHVTGIKVYPFCTNYNGNQAAPAHILACIGCHKSQLHQQQMSSLTIDCNTFQ